MELLKLTPSSKDYIWGGHKLIALGKPQVGEVIAETWELSFHPDGPCFIAEGEHKGEKLSDVLTSEELGVNCSRFPFFPVLIKFIDAEGDLSVQVHPSDEYALKNEGQYGKTEMWHILDVEPGCGLYVGFRRDTNPEEVEAKLKDGSILELCNFFEVKKGETYFIPSGTVHAIGKGVTVIEVQQNSNLTYRLYDYGRIGKDGKPRPLHIEKALKVLNYKAYEPIHFDEGILGECDYFRTSLHTIGFETVEAPEDSFASISILEGAGSFGNYTFRKGDTFLLPAGKKARLEGFGSYIKTAIPAKK